MTKDAFYFPHDSNAKDDPKMMFLIDQLGLEGYGIFWVLIETLREQKDYKAPITILPILARKYSTQVEKVKAVVTGYGLFKIEDSEFFFSQSLVDRLSAMVEKKQRKIEASKKAIAVRWSKNNSLPQHYEDIGSNTNVIRTYENENTNVCEEEYDSIPREKKRKDEKRKDEKIQDKTIKVDVRSIVDELMSYFDFNEQTHFNHLRTCTHFINTLLQMGMIDHYRAQFEAYKQYKALSNQIKHSFVKFVGDVEKEYQDGGWNAENWTIKLASLQPSQSPNADPYNCVSVMSRIAEQMKNELR